MATEQTETAAADTAPAAAAKTGGGLVKAIGTTFGLLVMLLATQLISPIIGCKFLHSVTPNCPAPAVEVDEKGEEVQEPKAPPIYLAMDPPIVASISENGEIRFLQVAVDVMARDDKIINAVKTHMPAIRNNLLMMLGGQTLSNLTDRDAKEKLRKQALEEVQKILKANGETGIEDLYFTSFVIQ